MTHAVSPMSFPTIAPTHLSLPAETRPRLRVLGEMFHCLPLEPKENPRVGGLEQLYIEDSVRGIERGRGRGRTCRCSILLRTLLNLAPLSRKLLHHP
jgi:hypothetical protein